MPKRKKNTDQSIIFGSPESQEILTEMARGPWASLWGDEQEAAGESLSGVDLYQAAPPTPRWAIRWAEDLAHKIVLANLNRARLSDKPGLEGLYEEARRAGFAKDRETFGFYLGMQSIGHGVNWTDDLRGRPDVEIVLPYDEFYRP